MENTFFLLFSSFSIIFSCFVILSRNPVHSILSLILVFFNASSLLLLLGSEFLAMLFVVVYVGAVAVLFLFVIMMLNIKMSSLSISIYRYLPVFFVLGSVFLLEFLVLFHFDLAPISLNNIYSPQINLINEWVDHVEPLNNIKILGRVLYTNYAYLFVLSGVILLVSMIGAITLTLHRRNDTKRQLVYKQIKRDFSSSILWKN